MVAHAAGAPQSPAGGSPAARVVGEVFTGGRQMRSLALLSDESGSRLTVEEVKKLAAETKVDAQWRTARIWL